MAAFGLEDGPAYILLATCTSIVWALKVFSIRLFMRLKINGPFGKDDWMCAISTTFGIVYSIVVIVQVAHGLGNEHSVSCHKEILQFLSWFNAYTLTLSVGFSKLSACFLIARITKTREHIAVAHALASAVVIWAVQAMLFNTFQCKFPTPWKESGTGTCYDLWGHTLGNGLTSYVIEVALLAAAVYLVWSIKMPFKTKARVVIAFALRLLLIPSSIIRLHYLHQMLHSANPKSFTVRLAIMGLVTCQISVISATFPCAKPFFTAFTRGIMHRPRIAILPTQRSGTRRKGSVAGSHPSRDRRISLAHLNLGPIRGVSSATVEHIPPEAASQLHRPSLVHSKHSDTSIIYSRSYDVSFQDVGGLMNQNSPVGTPTSTKSQRGERVRGSNAGFSWSSSRRISSQRSKTGSGDTIRSVGE